MNFQFIKNLQDKSEPVKKTIMWAGVSFLMSLIFLFWLFTFPFQAPQIETDERLANISKEMPGMWQTFRNQVDNLQELWGN